MLLLSSIFQVKPPIKKGAEERLMGIEEGSELPSVLQE